MLTKEEFIKIIEELKKHINRIRKIESALGCVFDFNMLDCTVVELLEKMLDLDVNDMYGSVLSWWMFELDFGLEWKPDSLTMDGEPIDISTADKLYDYLISSHR